MKIETVTSEPAVRALTTVQAVRDYIGGIDAADTAAASVLTSFILAASSRVRVDLGYRPWRTRYAGEWVAPSDRATLYLGSPVDPFVYSIVSSEGGEVMHFWADYGFVNSPFFLRGTTYALDYEAGWPVGPAAVQVPPDLQQAVIEMVAQAWHSRGRSPDVASEDLDGVASLNFEPRRTPVAVREVLDTYRLRGV